MQKLVLVGGGGHAKVILAAIQACNHMQPTYEVMGIYDDAQQEIILGLPRLGSLQDLAELTDEAVTVVLAIGSNALRAQLASEHSHVQFATIIHPTAVIEPDVKIGDGTVVMAGTIIQASVQVGQHCIINTGAILDHDVCIGNYSHIAQRVTLTDGVQVGQHCLLQAGTTVAPWHSITDGTIIPIGSKIG